MSAPALVLAALSLLAATLAIPAFADDGSAAAPARLEAMAPPAAALATAGPDGLAPSDTIMVLPNQLQEAVDSSSLYLNVGSTGPVQVHVDVHTGAHVGLVMQGHGACHTVEFPDGGAATVAGTMLKESYVLDCGSLPAGWYELRFSLVAGAAFVRASSPQGSVSDQLGDPGA